MATNHPIQIAILGAGTFVKSQYLPRLSEISNLFHLKAIWSRTEKSATSAVEIANKQFGQVECKWGDNGLHDIIQDPSIIAVVVVLAAQNQVHCFSLTHHWIVAITSIILALGIDSRCIELILTCLVFFK